MERYGGEQDGPGAARPGRREARRGRRRGQAPMQLQAKIRLLPRPYDKRMATIGLMLSLIIGYAHKSEAASLSLRRNKAGIYPRTPALTPGASASLIAANFFRRMRAGLHNWRISLIILV